MKNVTEQDLINVSQAHGTVYTMNNGFNFAFYSPKPNSYWIFMFDPKNTNMSLTNAVEQVIYEVLETLVLHNIISLDDLELVLSQGHFICRDSMDEFCEVSVKSTNSGRLQASLKYPGRNPPQNICISVSKFGDSSPRSQKPVGLSLKDVKEFRIGGWRDFNFTPELLRLMELLG